MEKYFKKLADRYGVVPVLSAFSFPLRVSIPLYEPFPELPLEQLNLSVRSSNALRTAKIYTVRELVQLIHTHDGLSKLRNIGSRSIAEIKTVLLLEAYQRLTDSGKEQFWKNILSTLDS